MSDFEPAEKDVTEMSDIELARKIAASDEWIPEDLAELARRAGLWEEWQDADGDTFESVAFKAAEILGVEIL